MAKEIKFNIKLLVDGKEQLVTATSSVKDLQNVVNGAKSESEKLTQKLLAVNQKLELIGNAASSMSKITGVLNDLTAESRSFGAAMGIANTMAGKSGDDFAKMKEQVSELSKTIPIARDELANGLYQVISNGVPEDNWLEYLNKSAKASIGGVANLGEVVKVTSTVIKNYGLSWGNAGDVQDKIQLTAKNGVTSFEQLAGALPRVTSNAATLGVSIDELLASFATLTGVSGNTNEVATQMAAVFTALVKPSSEATKMAQQMGIEFNAAAIKSAGGLQNFLTQLDSSVKSFAQSSGMLEQEVYGKLFGSAESLRAIGPLTGQLADTFAKNVSNMKDSAGTVEGAFSQLASTGKAKIQILNNKLGEFSDVVQATFGNFMPYLNFGTQLLVSFSSVTQLTTSLKSLGLVYGAVAKGAMMAEKAQVSLTAVTRVLTAAFKGEAVGATTAAVASRALTTALRGLLISTGIGVAVVALTGIIEHLASSSDDAADSTRQLTEAEQEAQAARQQEAQQIKEVYSALDVNIAKLKNFKGSREDEQRIVEEMNRTYGDSMGCYSTVAQWYTALVGNSKAYCQQMINEIRIRDLANRAAALQQQRQDITHDENGKARKYSMKRKTKRVAVGQVDAGDGKVLTQYADVEQKGSSDLEKATAKANALYRQEKAARTEMERLVKANQGIQMQQFQGYHKPKATPTRTTPMATTPSAHTPHKTNTPRPNAEPEKSRPTIEGETEPTIFGQGSVTDKRQSQANAQQRIERIRQDYEVGITGKDEAERQIAEINSQLAELGMKPIDIQLRTHADELQEQLRKAQAEFDNATTIDAKVEANAKVADIQRQIDEETRGKVTIEAEAEPSYIVQGSVADKRQSYANAQGMAQRIQQDYEIGIIGKDEAERQLAEVNNKVKALGLEPVTLTFDTKGADKAKDKMQGACDAVKQMGSSLSGLGDAIGVPELNIAGTLAQAIATMTQGYATATTQAATMGPWAWIAFAATGLAQLTAMISAVKQANTFATGGVIGGTSTSGDKKFARVNSGEMILNKWQQARLFSIVNTPRFVPPVFASRPMRSVSTPTGQLADVQPAQTVVNINMNAKARRMLEVMAEERRVAAKSGRRYDI